MDTPARYRAAVRRDILWLAGLDRWLLGALLAVLLVLPLVVGPLLSGLYRFIPLTFFNAGEQYFLRVFDQAGLYILLALGLNIVVGYAGLLDLGYVAFYAVGAYTYGLLASPIHGLHLPFWVILPLAVAIAMIFGALLGFPTLRLRGDYLAIVTLGFGEIIRILLNNLDSLTNGPRGINALDTPSLWVVRFVSPRDYYYLILTLCVIAVIFAYRLQDSFVGRAWAAIREDEDAAHAMGVDVVRMKLLAYVMGASTAGFAGAVFAGLQGFVSPDSFIFLESVLILSMVVLGGMGHIPGVILGAVILIVLPEVLRQFQDYRMVVYGLGLTLMMLVRPEGLWPSRQRRLELHAEQAAELAVQSQEASASGELTHAVPEA